MAGSVITTKLMFLIFIVLLVLHMYADVDGSCYSCSYEHYMRVYSGAWMGLVTRVAMNITCVFTVVRGRVLLLL